MQDDALAGRLAGAIWGHLVGDAMGVPYEFRRPDDIGEIDAIEFGARGSHGQPPGTWSDDGALMLALLDSLLEAGFDPEDQGRRALAWDDDHAYTPDSDGRFDIGNATFAALKALRAGSPAIEAGPSGDRDCGNGSLMRILPLALVERDLPAPRLVERAHLASRVTHGHPRCQVACALYCLVVVGLLRGVGPGASLVEARAGAREIYAADPSLAAHLAALDEIEAWPGRRGGGYVIDSFWSAWDAFAGATDYADTIRRAIAYGNDTDTTAAIAGGLAGAHWGWASIPLPWRRGMRGRDIVTPLVDRLLGPLGVKTSTAKPLRVDGIPLEGTRLEDTGRVGITFLPGKKRDGYTGPHWRDLDLDLARLRDLGVDALFLLVEDVELEWCEVTELPELMAAAGPELLRFPIRDPRLPADPAAFVTAIRGLVERIASGESIAIACRAGIDRSGMAAACLLVEAGLEPEAAIARVQGHRRGSITLGEQQAFVRGWRSPGPEDPE
jgi:ADP-ribosylglycohydrolase/protein-tyrosine phosphatase